MLGAGTQSNPYLISTPQDLHNVRNNLTAYYELTNDIDMSSWGNWLPISYYDNKTWVNGFSGHFDGKGFKIKNLTINKSGGIYLGLFGQFNFGTLQNVGLENVIINLSSQGERFTGALVGFTYGSTIKNCFVNGGFISAQDESGGLIGKLDSATVEDCYSNIEVKLNTSYYGGGFVGAVDSNSTISRCYSVGKVTYTTSSSYNGKSGFVGFIRNNTDIFFQNCYFDKQTSTQSTSQVTGINARTTNEMQTQSTFNSWDFTITWSINSDYPTLQMFGLPEAPPKIETISVISFSKNINSDIEKSKKSNKQTNTFIDDVFSHSNRHTATIRQLEGYLLPINTIVHKSTRSVKSGTEIVTSFMNTIGASVERKSKTMKQLLSYLEPIHADVSVIYPLDNRMYKATIITLENPSRAFKMDNMTNTYYIVNPSHSEVIH